MTNLNLKKPRGTSWTIGGSEGLTRSDLPDPLEGATDSERRHFLASYHGKPIVDILRSLRKAESNAEHWHATNERLLKRLSDLGADQDQQDSAVPPSGWDLPKPAVELLECADRNGWLSLTQWNDNSRGEPFVRITLKREVVGERWVFDHLTWVASGKGASMALRGRGLQSTPECPAWHDAPSLKKIRELIEANPA